MTFSTLLLTNIRITENFYIALLEYAVINIKHLVHGNYAIFGV